MKLGVIEDAGNKQRLAKLVRFPSTRDPEALTSLDAYISRMPESQKDIYYLAGACWVEGLVFGPELRIQRRLLSTLHSAPAQG